MKLKQMRADALKAAQDIADAAKAAGRDLTDEEVTEVEAKLAEVDELDKQIAQAEKSAGLIGRLAGVKTVDDAPADPAPGKGPAAGPFIKGASIGLKFIKSPAFEAFKEQHPSAVTGNTPISVHAKGIGTVADLGLKATLTTDNQGEFAQYPQREPGYRDYLPASTTDAYVPTFMDLITVGVTDQAYGEYARVISEVDNAAVVAEGALKPLSDIGTDLKSSKAYVYADGFDVTNQTLADDGALVAFMDSRIRRHVLGVVERKLFNGTGAGVEPEGIMNTTGTLAQAFDTDALTSLARAIDKFENANPDVEPQAIVMNSTDIWNLRLLKVNGEYLLGNPLQQGLIPTPWGIPIIKSNKLTAGQALVGRFDSVNFLQMEALNVMAFNQHKDYAQRNMVYVRAEMRGRQLFYAPREVVITAIKAAA